MFFSCILELRRSRFLQYQSDMWREPQCEKKYVFATQMRQQREVTRGNSLSFFFLLTALLYALLADAANVMLPLLFLISAQIKNHYLNIHFLLINNQLG